MRALTGGCRLMTGREMQQACETMPALQERPGTEKGSPQRGLKRVADMLLRADPAAGDAPNADRP